MRYAYLIICLLVFGYSATAQEGASAKVKKENSIKAINEMRKTGALIVRLKTKRRNIEALERVLKRKDLSDGQRKRHEGIIKGIVKKRDKRNRTMMQAFKDSFNFCPIYFMMDTSSSELKDSVRTGIFFDLQDGNIVPVKDVTSSEKHVFIADYRESGGEYPFDVITVRRLELKLSDPFPYYVPVRASFINESRLSTLKKAVDRLDNKMKRYYVKNRRTSQSTAEPPKETPKGETKEEPKEGEKEEPKEEGGK